MQTLFLRTDLSLMVVNGDIATEIQLSPEQAMKLAADLETLAAIARAKAPR